MGSCGVKEMIAAEAKVENVTRKHPIAASVLETEGNNGILARFQTTQFRKSFFSGLQILGGLQITDKRCIQSKLKF